MSKICHLYVIAAIVAKDGLFTMTQHALARVIYCLIFILIVDNFSPTIFIIIVVVSRLRRVEIV